MGRQGGRSGPPVSGSGRAAPNPVAAAPNPVGAAPNLAGAAFIIGASALLLYLHARTIFFWPGAPCPSAYWAISVPVVMSCPYQQPRRHEQRANSTRSTGSSLGLSRWTRANVAARHGPSAPLTACGSELNFLCFCQQGHTLRAVIIVVFRLDRHTWTCITQCIKYKQHLVETSLTETARSEASKCGPGSCHRQWPDS